MKVDEIKKMVDLWKTVFLLIAAFLWGGVFVNTYGNWHITEAERTEAFDEGVAYQSCVIHRTQLGYDIGECKQRLIDMEFLNESR